MTAHKNVEGQRFVHEFLDGDVDEAGDALTRLGERGAALSRMGGLGVRVPEGCVVCVDGTVDDDALRGLDGQIGEALGRLEGETGRAFKDPENPLVLAAHAEFFGAAGRSIFHLGLDEATVEAIAQRSGDGCEAYRAYLRFLEAFGRMVHGVDGVGYPEPSDRSPDEGDPEQRVREVRQALRGEAGEEVPDDALGQLMAIVRAARDGTSRVTVTRQISSGEGSFTGVARTHDRRTGEKGATGEFVAGGEGQDPLHLQEMERLMPGRHEGL